MRDRVELLVSSPLDAVDATPDVVCQPLADLVERPFEETEQTQLQRRDLLDEHFVWILVQRNVSAVECNRTCTVL